MSGSALLPQYQGKGIGVAMYLGGAALGWREDGYALVADACMMSSTSTEARRVWKSSEFRKQVRVGIHSGLVGVWKEK